jgi:Ca2+-binding RTX toxin-like protein
MAAAAPTLATSATDYIQVAQQLYMAYFGRPADRSGLINMTNALFASGAPTTAEGIAAAYLAKSNATVTAIMDNFGSSDESKALYGSAADGDAKFVSAVYHQVLNKSPDLPGLDFWMAALANHTVTRAGLASQIIAAATKDGADATDALTVANKVTVATNFTAAIDTAEEVIGYSGNAAAAQARDLLQSVTSTTNTTTYQAQVDSVLHEMANPPEVVNNINLTANADNIPGTTGADMINATLPLLAGVADSSATLTAGDVITGGSGNDTLSITVSGTAGTTTVTPTIRTTEKVLVSNLASTGSVTVDLTLADTAVTNIGTAASTTDGVTTKFANVGSLIAIQQAGRGDLEVGFAAGVTNGTNDSLTVTLNTVGDTTSGQFTTSGIETLNLVSSGTGNAVTVSDTGLKTVNVSGAADVSVDFVTLTATTIDASKATGSVYIDGTGLTLASTTVTGGSGTSDEFVTNTTTVSNTTLANVKGFEVLGLSGAAATATLTAAVAGVSTFDLRTGSANAQTLNLNAGYTGATTVKVDAGDKVTNAANVALTVSGSVTNFNGTTVTGGTGTDAIKMSANGGTAALGGLTNIESITISASSSDPTKGATLTGLTTDATKTVTVDASALGADAALTFTAGTDAGHLSIVGGAGADSITAGNGGDTIVGGAGKDTINAGTGVDNINAGDAADTINMAANLTSDDTIDGGAGSDTLVVDSVGTNAFAHVTNIENVKFSATAANINLAAPLTTSTVTLDLTDTGVQSLTLATGYTGATTVKIGTGDTLVNAANVALTVTGTATTFNTSTITGGTGTDALTITANSTASANISGVTNVETITIAASSTLGQGITLTGAVGSVAGKTTTIDASALTDTTAAFGMSGVTAADNSGLSIKGGAGVNTIDWSGAQGDVTVVGGALADVFTAGAGIDSISSGAGNDTIDMGGNLSFDDTVDGGAGTDTLTYSGGAVIGQAGQFAHVTGIEVLKLVGAGSGVSIGSSTPGFTSFNLAAASAQSLVINPGFASAVSVNVTGNLANADLIQNDAGVAMTVSGNMADVASSTITGGTGVDTLSLRADTVNATLTNKHTGIENITIRAAEVASTATGILTLDATNVASGKTMTIDASALTDSAATFTLAGGLATVDATLVVTGGSGSDSIVAGLGTDTVNGGAGSDYIDAKTGNDVLTGGTGNDVFNMNGNTSKLTFASVTDFTAGDVLRFGFAAGSTSVPSKVTLNVAATLSDYLDAAAAGGANTLSWFQFGGNTYVVGDVTAGATFTAGTTADKVIQLNGLVDMSASNIQVNGSQTFWQLGTATALTAPVGALTFTDAGGAAINFVGTALADTFTFAGNLTAADTVLGGAGNDTITVSAAATDALFTKVSAVEILDLGTNNVNATLSSLAIAAGIRTVTHTGNGAVVIDVSGAAADMSISTGTGADTITMGSTLTAADTIAGGATGTDTLKVTGTLVDAAFTKVTSMEVLDLTGTTASVTLGALASASGITSVTTSATGNVTINTAADTAVLSITGGAGNDTLVGSSAAQSITGAAGNDTITGGTGADVIDGGTGTDTYVYSTLTDSAIVTIAGTTVAGAGIDAVTVTVGDSFSFTGVTALLSGAAAVAVGGAVTDATQVMSLIAAGITEVANTAYLVTFTGTGNTAFNGNYLVVTGDTTFSANDTIIQLVGATTIGVTDGAVTIAS